MMQGQRILENKCHINSETKFFRGSWQTPEYRSSWLLDLANNEEEIWRCNKSNTRKISEIFSSFKSQKNARGKTA